MAYRDVEAQAEDAWVEDLGSKETVDSEEAALNKADVVETEGSAVEDPAERGEISAEEEGADVAALDAERTPRVVQRRERIILLLTRTCFSTGTRLVLRISVSDIFSYFHFRSKLQKYLIFKLFRRGGKEAPKRTP